MLDYYTCQVGVLRIHLNQPIIFFAILPMRLFVYCLQLEYGIWDLEWNKRMTSTQCLDDWCGDSRYPSVVACSVPSSHSFFFQFSYRFCFRRNSHTCGTTQRIYIKYKRTFLDKS